MHAQLLPAAELAAIARVLAAHGEVYLLGSALAEGARPDPPTLNVSGEAIRFVYADAEPAADVGPPVSARVTASDSHLDYPPNDSGSAAQPMFAHP
jgi:hypothetical protein